MRENRTDVAKAGNGTEFAVLAFKQLETMHVTADHLLKWSAPIDLVERYAVYLRDQPHSNSEYEDSTFYNCTEGWFGPRCEYTFDSEASFPAIVKRAFQNRHWQGNDLPDPSITCYTHLSCKYGGADFACLDWREVCDGKVDCANGGNDEKHCFELEMNECEENEYRCQNGLCVAHEFYRDDIFNHECLDRTDESNLNYYSHCASDPSFRCEEHTCMIPQRLQRAFACGDGQCSRHKETCASKRDILIINFDSYAEKYGRCWKTMACLTKFLNEEIKTVYDKWCRNLNTISSQQIIQEHCPSLFEFPIDWVSSGHVRLLYTNDTTISQGKYLLPKYVCFKQELCPRFSSAIPP